MTNQNRFLSVLFAILSPFAFVACGGGDSPEILNGYFNEVGTDRNQSFNPNMVATRTAIVSENIHATWVCVVVSPNLGPDTSGYACGAGNVGEAHSFDGTSCTCRGNPPVLPPVETAKEAKALYDNLPGMLVGYFGNETLNPKMLTTITETTGEAGARETRVVIVYQGIEIYNNVTHWSYYTRGATVSHGFLTDGTYIVTVSDESNWTVVENGQTYQVWGTKDKVFLNGTRLPLKTQYLISGIREVNDSWWVISTDATPLREAFPHFHESMALFNRHTGEVIELGEYPCQGPQFGPCS